MSAPTCATCVYYAEGTSDAFPNAEGMCRRYAPQGPTALSSKASGWQIFPPMSPDQWCGDHRPLGTSAAKACAA